MDTADLMARLRRHYIKPGENLPGGIFLPEVSWNGRGGARRCDAIYVGFTSTSGQILIGHELKTSRADLLKELDDTYKADEWAKECHQWWLVLSDKSIASGIGIPSPWGVMVPGRSKTRLEVVKPAYDKPRGHVPSWDACRSVMARQDTLRAHAISDAREKAYRDVVDNNGPRIEAAVAERLKYQPEVEQLVGRIKAVETALGGPIDWEAERRGYVRGGKYVGLSELALIASAVRAAGDVQAAVDGLIGKYSNPVTRTRGALDDLEKALTQLKEAHSGSRNR